MPGITTVISLSLPNLTTPIINSPGLFYDPIGTVKYYNDFYNVITFSDLSYFKPHIDNLNSILDTSKSICSDYPSYQTRIDCINVLSPLEIMLNNVNNNFHSLSHLTSTNSTRFKRSAWFGFGGPILKQLFGSLDEDDAKAFTDAINSVQDDQRHLAGLMKNNIHVISSTISTFNKTIKKLNDNEINLNENMQKLNKVLETISDDSNRFQASIHLAMTFSALESSLMILNSNIKDLIDAILFGKINIVHPSILSPTQLFNELSSNPNIHHNFPISVSINSIHMLMDIADVASFVNDDKLVFVIKIPLVSLTEYNLFHVYALPTPHDIQKPNSFAMINPSTKYLAITDDRLLYTLNDNRSECKVIPSKYYLCKLNNVYSSVSNQLCEVSILTEHISAIPNTCNYKLIIGSIDIFQKISNNRWLYVQSDITKITVKCTGFINDYDIVGSGILSIPRDCTGYHKLLQFTPSNEYDVQIHLPTPNFNIIEDDCCSKQKVNKSISFLTPIKLSHINLDSLQYASHNLERSVDELNKIENQPYHITYGYYFSILTTLLSISVFSFIFYKIYRCFCKNNPKDGCCIQIYNHCNSKSNTRVKSKSSFEMTDIEFTSEDSTSPKTLRRNLDFNL